MKTYCIACEIEQHDLCRFNGCTCPCAGECDESTPVCHNPQHWDEDQFHCGLCELDEATSRRNGGVRCRVHPYHDGR